MTTVTWEAAVHFSKSVSESIYKDAFEQLDQSLYKANTNINPGGAWKSASLDPWTGREEVVWESEWAVCSSASPA